MWIRMISTAAGPRLPHCLQSGSVYQVSDELGRELVEARAAVETRNPQQAKKAETAAEVASVDDGEKAVDPAGDKKSESLIDKLTKADANGAVEDNEADGQPANDAAPGKKSAKASAKKSAKASAKKS